MQRRLRALIAEEEKWWKAFSERDGAVGPSVERFRKRCRLMNRMLVIVFAAFAAAGTVWGLHHAWGLPEISGNSSTWSVIVVCGIPIIYGITCFELGRRDPK